LSWLRRPHADIATAASVPLLPSRKAQLARPFSVGGVNQSALAAAGDHRRAPIRRQRCVGLADGFDVALLLRRARYVVG
jgi:hypothetical protein